MTHPGTTLADVMNRSHYLLFDFDGPICSIFAGLSAPSIANDLRELATNRDAVIPADVTASNDPFDVLRFAATISRDLAQAVADELRALELRAVEVADPTPDAHQVIEAAHHA